MQYMRLVERIACAFPIRNHDCEALEVPSLEASKLKLREQRGVKFLRHGIFCCVRWMLWLKIKKSASVSSNRCRWSGTFAYGRHVPSASITLLEGQRYTAPHDHTQINVLTKESADVKSSKRVLIRAGAFSAWWSIGLRLMPEPALFQWFLFTSITQCSDFSVFGDLAWAPVIHRALVSWLVATAVVLTLNGEGLQAWRCHSPYFQAGLIPNCISYRSDYSYEVGCMFKMLGRMFRKKRVFSITKTVMMKN